jgi:copper(I)-binding protein
LALAILALSACSDDKKEQDPGVLTVKDAWVRATAPQTSGAMADMATATPDGMPGMATVTPDALNWVASMGQTTGAFMVIENTTGQAERLIRVEVAADVASLAEIHETTVDSNQVMQMRPVEGIDVPAHGSVELKAGSYHVMLMDVKKALNAGDKVTLTLVFESGQRISVEAEVRPLG